MVSEKDELLVNAIVSLATALIATREELQCMVRNDREGEAEASKKVEGHLQQLVETLNNYTSAAAKNG